MILHAAVRYGREDDPMTAGENPIMKDVTSIYNSAQSGWGAQKDRCQSTFQ
jgi:hypothetical protein